MRQAQERLGSELESRLSRQTSISALRLPSLAPVLPGCGGICNLRAVGCPPFAHFEGLWEPSCADNGLSGGGREGYGRRKTGDRKLRRYGRTYSVVQGIARLPIGMRPRPSSLLGDEGVASRGKVCTRGPDPPIFSSHRGKPGRELGETAISCPFRQQAYRRGRGVAGDNALAWASHGVRLLVTIEGGGAYAVMPGNRQKAREDDAEPRVLHLTAAMVSPSSVSCLLSSVRDCPPSPVIRPPSSVRDCPPSPVIRPLSSVLRPLSSVLRPQSPDH